MGSRKLLATLLALAMTLSLLSVGAFASENEENGVMPISDTEQTAPVSSFTDTTDSWAAAAIERWAGYGVVNGTDGEFRPDAQMTVAELATTLNNLMGYTAKAENTFADLNGDEWYADAVLKLAAAGILQGDGTYINATAPVSRERATVIMARTLNIQPDPEADLSAFTDGASASDWSAGYIKAMADAKIINGVGDNTLALNLDINRASVMTIMDKSISDYITEGGDHAVKSEGIVIVKAGAAVTLTGTAKDIIVAPAAAKGSVTLNKTTVNGAVTVNADNAQLIAKDAKLTDVMVSAAGAAVDLQGKSSTKTVVVTATAPGAVLTVAKDAKVDIATVAATGTTTTINGTVKTIGVTDSAADTKIEVAKGATVSKVESAGDKTAVTGAGKVENVTVTGGEGTSVTTPGTSIKNEGEAPVSNGKGEVKPGESGKADGTLPGGSTGNGGGYEPPVDPFTHVTSEEQLTTALAGTATQIKLDANITLTKQILITRAVTLDGGNHTVTAKATIEGTNAERCGILVKADDVILQNLTVSGPNSRPAVDGTTNWDAGQYGIQVYESKRVTLNNVTVTNANVGILVNSAEVTLTGTITVSKNEFGGIEVAKGGLDAVTTSTSLPKLTLASGVTLVNDPESAAVPTIWIDKYGTGEEELPASVVDVGSLKLNTLVNTEKKQMYFFLDAAKSGAEAVVDGVCYATLAEAVAAGGTVKLLDDVTVNNDIIISSAVTLDLAGTTLTLAGEKNSPAGINCEGVNANLTLTDSGEGGVVKSTDTHKGSGYGMFSLQDGAKMTMDSGNINADFGSGDMTTAQTEGRFAVTVFNESEFTMDGGTITAGWYAVSTNGTMDSSKPNYGNDAKITINDGMLISTGDYAVYAPAKGGVTEINGGTIKGAWGAVQVNNGTLTMTRGDLYNTGAAVGEKPGDQTDGSTPDNQTVISAKGAYGATTVEISGGSLNSAPGQEVITKGNNATISITACKSTHKIPDAYCANGYESTGKDTSWTVAVKSVQP